MSFSLRVNLQVHPFYGASLQANIVSVGYAGYRAILFMTMNLAGRRQRVQNTLVDLVIHLGKP